MNIEETAVNTLHEEKTTLHLEGEKILFGQRFFAQPTARRKAFRVAGVAVVACWMTSKLPLVAAQSVEGDVAILTAALYLEHEAIAAYQAGAESKLLSPGILKVAVAFQSDHKYHRDALSGAIHTLGGQPSGPEKSYDFGRLRSENDILRLARNREDGAVHAYGTLASNIQNKTVLNVGANVLVDEVRHRSVLNSVLGVPNY